jgi:putative tryptophan/tyrosine transport system substrate-binding protein
MPRLGIAAALIPALLAGALPAAHFSVLVVTESGVEAYTEAVNGVSSVLPAGTFQVLDVADKTLERELAGSGETRVTIAVGSRALAVVRAQSVSGQVVAAMCLRAVDADSNTRRVDLDVSLAAQLAAMRTLWPGRTRAGIIRGPGQSRPAADALEASARKEGFSLAVVDSDGPAHLLKSLAALRGKADFVLCLPNAALYNPVTIKPLVLSSLEQRLPLVGFSPAFVRAGAAIGIFPDYGEIGRQAGEMALQALRQEHTEDQSPRKVRVAINQRVAHLLGVEFRGGALAAEVYR